MRHSKYIKTWDNQIIVFPASMKHSDFKKYRPVSAGFIDIYPEDGKMVCNCHGRSTTLGLDSDERDSLLSRIQYFPEEYF